jgi:hypothetical protein
MCGALSARSTTRRGKFNPVMPTPPSNDNSLVARWQYFFLHPVLKHPANQNDLLDYIYAALADPQIKGILFDVRHGSTQKIETAALNRAYKVQMINIVFYGRPEGHRTRQGRWAEWRPAANRPAVSAHRGTDGRISSDAAGQTDGSLFAGHAVRIWDPSSIARAIAGRAREISANWGKVPDQHRLRAMASGRGCLSVSRELSFAQSRALIC